ncbi:hypothetical protein [Xanthomonas vesicatoria]|uniref:hypothetical protein n=1 Tax=Xanthomonas vesicatoria TaxID=56460 RepID=UPI001E49B9E0|nr:hypothetical protein [Xanthomonas vesicatoria]MCC8618820.1 hypothetical protein [Xanthomonas vesicatoria]
MMQSLWSSCEAFSIRRFLTLHKKKPKLWRHFSSGSEPAIDVIGITHRSDRDQLGIDHIGGKPATLGDRSSECAAPIANHLEIRLDPDRDVRDLACTCNAPYPSSKSNIGLMKTAAPPTVVAPNHRPKQLLSNSSLATPHVVQTLPSDCSTSFNMRP